MIQRGRLQRTGGGGVSRDAEALSGRRSPEVHDPEYPVSLVDMGLVRGVEIEARPCASTSRTARSAARASS